MLTEHVLQGMSTTSETINKYETMINSASLADHGRSQLCANYRYGFDFL